MGRKGACKAYFIYAKPYIKADVNDGAEVAIKRNVVIRAAATDSIIFFLSVSVIVSTEIMTLIYAKYVPNLVFDLLLVVTIPAKKKSLEAIWPPGSERVRFV